MQRTASDVNEAFHDRNIVDSKKLNVSTEPLPSRDAAKNRLQYRQRRIGFGDISAYDDSLAFEKSSGPECVMNHDSNSIELDLDERDKQFGAVSGWSGCSADR